MDAVLERRLRPLYDMIELKNYKGALKQANVLLQKHPESLHVKLLKALVLERKGQEEEALAICRQVKDAMPTDERVLNDLYQIFYRLGHVEESTQSYENACKQNPGNAELEVSLFMAYLREDNYVKQQQVASRIYKKLGEEKFLMWAVCSIELQVRSNPDQEDKLLQLAEAMLRRRAGAQGLKEHESVLVYLHILQRQGKYSAALEVLEGSLGQLFTITADRLRLKADLLMRLGQFSEARAVYEEVLVLSSDDWATLVDYLDAVLECVPPSAKAHDGQQGRIMQAQSKMTATVLSPLSIEEVEQRLSMVMETFLQDLQSLSATGLRRGPFLVELEIARRRMQHGLGIAEVPKSTPQLAQAIAAYFQKFGYMVSFASDVLQYTCLVEGDSRSWLSSALHGACVASSNTPEQLLRRQIAAMQVDEHLRLPVEGTLEDLVSRGKRLLQLYEESIPLSALLDYKEEGVGAELLSLVANCLVEMHARTGLQAYLLEAVLIVEHGLRQRPFNPQQKLIVISLYCLLAAPNLAWETFQTMDMKHILLETLSHHVLRPLLQCGRWQEVRSMFTLMNTFHDDHRRDAPELTSVAFRHGTYSKILEFVEFRDTLQRSHPNLLMRIEGHLVSISEEADNAEKVKILLGELKFGKTPLEWVSQSNMEKLVFTEDFSTRRWWWPAPTELHLLTGVWWESSGRNLSWHELQDETLWKRRHEEMRRAVTKRCLLPRLMSLALQLEGGKREDGEELQDLVKRLSHLSGLNPTLPHSSLSDPGKLGLEEQEGRPPTLELLDAELFAAAATFLDAASDLSHTPEAAMAAGDAFTMQLMGIKELLKEAVETLCKAAVVNIDGAHHVGGREWTGGMTALSIKADKGLAVASHSEEQEGDHGSKALGTGLGMRGLASFVLNQTAWLGLLLRHWNSSLKDATVQKKKTKAVDKAAEGLGMFARKAQEALKELAQAAGNSLDSICSLLQYYLAQPVAAEVAAWSTVLQPAQFNGTSSIEGEGARALPWEVAPGALLRELGAGSSLKLAGGMDALEDVAKKMVQSQRIVANHVYDVAALRAKLLKKINS